jgi:hypothetical protein
MCLKVIKGFNCRNIRIVLKSFLFFIILYTFKLNIVLADLQVLEDVIKVVGFEDLCLALIKNLELVTIDLRKNLG